MIVLDYLMNWTVIPRLLVNCDCSKYHTQCVITVVEGVKVILCCACCYFDAVWEEPSSENGLQSPRCHSHLQL